MPISAEQRRALLVHHARWCAAVGFKEDGDAPNTGTFVEFVQKAVDGRAMGEPWCAAFVWACLQYVDHATSAAFGQHTTTLLAASEHVMTMWRRSTDAAKVPTPLPGDLMVWRHHRNGEPTEAGHVGIVVEVGLEGGRVRTVEGNTRAGEGVVREGDGVYERIRQLEGEGSMRTVGFLRPWL